MEKQILARAVLFEQYENEVDVKRATENLISELEQRNFRKEAVPKWYAKFSAGVNSITNGVSTMDSTLMRNGTFLTSMRAMVFEINSFSWTPCQLNGLNSRLLISNPDYAIAMDTYYGTVNSIVFDYTSIAGEQPDDIILNSLQFLNENCIWGTMYVGEEGLQKLFSASFNFITYTLKFNKIAMLHHSYRSFILEDKTKHQFSVLSYLELESMQLLNLKMNDEDWETVETIDVPINLSYPTIRNGNLYGFRWGDTESLVEFSLTSRTTREHKLRNEDGPSNEARTSYGHVWIDNELLVAQHDQSTGLPRIFLFDIVDLIWRPTNFEVKGWVNEMQFGNHLLTVHSHMDMVTWFHQFPYRVTSSLADTTWKAVRQYAKFNDEFGKWFESKLSKSSKFRPLW